MDLTIKCVNDGELHISLKGRDIRDKNRIRFPVYIDYTSLKINGEEMLEESQLTWHDKPYVHTKPVANGEELKIHLEWKPFDGDSVYKP